MVDIQTSEVDTKLAQSTCEQEILNAYRSSKNEKLQIRPFFRKKG
jgi:hypothetical protein